MNDSPSPSERVNFPESIGAGASERQAQYRGKAPGQGGKANQRAVGASNADANTDADALVVLVQDLTQKNHALLSQVRDLESALAAQEPSHQPGAIPSANSTTDAQVTYLLNQLEFAQQANQRQAIRIENLAQQVNTDRMQLVQLEQDSQAFQKRCRAQSNRIEQLEQRCGELQQRLQRQQRYTLQFKTALDKCLEVPPPSYASLDTDAVGDVMGPVSDASLNPEDSLTSLVSPMLPKASSIPAWTQPHSNSSHGTPGPGPGQTDPLDPSRLSSAGSAGVIKPLKPELQVPQMSRFKTALFSLAHQPSPQTQAPPAQPEPQSGPLSEHQTSSHNASSPDASGPDASSPNVPDLNPPEAATTMGLDASAPQPSAPQPASASENDAFWSDLVQMVGTAAPEPASAPQPRPTEKPSQASPLPPAVPSPQRTAKSRGASEGVETLFDVVLQGAKAIATQLMPSEDAAPDAQAALTQQDASLPKAVPSPSAPPAPRPLPTATNNAAASPAPPTMASEVASEAPSEAPLEPSLEPSSPLPQTRGPAPRLSPQTKAKKRDRIDLPTFLRPQPQ